MRMDGKVMEENRRITIIQIDEIRWYNVGAWYAVNLSRGLAEMGHRVIFISGKGLPPGEKAREAGLEVMDDFSFSPSRFPHEARGLARIINKTGARLICAHRAGSMNLALMARMLERENNAAVVRARFDARPVKTGRLNGAIYRLIDGVLSPNSETARRHVVGLGMPPEKVRVLPGGVDTELFRPVGEADKVRLNLGVPAESPLVGIVGRLDHVKGHEHFLRAAAQAAEKIPDARFAIIGKQVNITVARLKKLAQELNISHKLVFVSSEVEVNKLVAALDVGVVASTGSEALSRVALEYMACAVPVVATRVGGLPETVENGVTGLTVPPADAVAMAEAIRRLLTDKATARKMGEAGRKRAVELYSRPELARRAGKFFMEIINRRAKQ